MLTLGITQMSFPSLYRKTSLCSTCHSPAKCHCSHRADSGSTIPKCKQAGSTHPTEIIILNREFAHVPQGHVRRVDEQPAVSALDGSGCGKKFCCVGKRSIYPGSPSPTLLHAVIPPSSAPVCPHWATGGRRMQSNTLVTDVFAFSTVSLNWGCLSFSTSEARSVI